ncbi:MAG: hypothetical protein AAF490_29315 [Chloroflexota bacterium]
MSQASDYLYLLASKITKPYTALPTLRAAMVTGSVAKGLSDHYSDIDMTYYYEETLPEESVLASIREGNGGSERKWIIGDRKTGSFAEAFHIDGVEVQIGHTTIESWEKSMAEVLENHNVDTPLHKAMEGTINSKALFGETYMAQWQAQIAGFPDELAEAMVQHNLQFFPLWGLEPHFSSRDATVWYYQSLVESAHRLIAILAGLNRLYFTTFQFKRMARFINQMSIKPNDLTSRLESLFSTDFQTAVSELESLVAETVALVEQHMPTLDTTKAKARIGWRQEPWEPNI